MILYSLENILKHSLNQSEYGLSWSYLVSQPSQAVQPAGFPNWTAEKWPKPLENHPIDQLYQEISLGWFIYLFISAEYCSVKVYENFFACFNSLKPLTSY